MTTHLATEGRPTPLTTADPASEHGRVDALVDATPDSRDRVVDGLRGLSITVVVVWHWALSITHVSNGALTMPNPIDQARGLWLATWLLQIMPVFFIVGGYANLAAWTGVRRRGGGWTAYAKRRVDRLLQPIGIYVALWLVADVAIRFVRPGTPSVLSWGRVVFIPLWFLGIYLAVVLVAPFLAQAHARRPGLTLALLGGLVIADDLARLHLSFGPAGTLNSLLVWVFAHQLGFFWRDGSATAWSLARRMGVAATGLAGLILLTVTGWYPSSMVAVRGEAVSNMNPTSLAIAALAVFQFGLVLTFRPALDRFLQRRSVWKATVALNAVAMTVFTWHMTALVIVIGIWRALGLTLLSQPTATWWAQRPLWLILPGVVLAGLLTVFARFELPANKPSTRS